MRMLLLAAGLALALQYFAHTPPGGGVENANLPKQQ